MTDPLFDLTGRRVLLTGAGGALGSVMARAFGERGAHVAVHDLSPERVAPVVEAIQAAGGQAVAVVGDVSTAQASADVVRQGADALGGLDVLLNGVGINRRKPMEEVTPEDFDAIVSVNLRAIYFASQAAHAVMRPQGKGCIVNLSSLSARFSFNTISVYSATKAGVSSLTRSCAREWAADVVKTWIDGEFNGAQPTPQCNGALQLFGQSAGFLNTQRWRDEGIVCFAHSRTECFYVLRAGCLLDRNSARNKSRLHTAVQHAR